MNNKFEPFLQDFERNTGASEELITGIENEIGINLPLDFKELLMYTNGGEGFIGSEYFILWKAEELKLFNSEYEVEKYANGLFLFASNGGGESFAFDTRSAPYKVVQVPFIGISLNEARNVAETVTQLLEKLAKSNGPLF